MKVIFSIRYKFLLVTTLLLVLCVGAYLALATKILRGDKTELVYDYNRSTVSNLASDTDTYFKGIGDKIKLIAYFFNEKESRSSRLMQELLQSDTETVYVGSSNQFQTIEHTLFVHPTYAETYGLSDQFFTSQLPQQRSIPFERIRVDGEAVWNATTHEGPPLIGFGRSVVEETETGIPMKQYAVISYLRADKLMNALGRGSFNEVFMTNDHGEVLVHTDLNVMKNNLKPDLLTEKAIHNPLNTSVLPTEIDGKKFLGAFSKAFNKKILIISKVSENKAFGVVYRLIYRSLFFALIVVTAAFIAAILFSRSLTLPLETLMGGMKMVSTGNLGTQIKVKTRDEIAVLADSFNHMIQDLKNSREELEHINAELENKVKERTRQLELQNQAVKNAQEALLRTTRLAAVGEIAGRAAHEVLNPLTGIMSRIQKLQTRLQNQKESEMLLLNDIVTGWEQEFTQGGVEKLLLNWQSPSQIKPQTSLLEEDIGNIKIINEQWHDQVIEVSSDIEFLLKECQRMNRIVQSMRSLSVIKSEPQPHSLQKLIQESVHIMADLASQMNSELTLTPMTDPWTVMVDEDEFIQSLTNLLRNALQATKDKALHQTTRNYRGSVIVTVHSREQKILLSIKDNGIGIEEQHREKLFETQFSTKSKEEGTGLGLNISRRFIRSFGGDIYLHHSHINEGTEFIIELPLAQEDHENGTDKERIPA